MRNIGMYLPLLHLSLFSFLFLLFPFLFFSLSFSFSSLSPLFLSSLFFSLFLSSLCTQKTDLSSQMIPQGGAGLDVKSCVQTRCGFPCCVVRCALCVVCVCVCGGGVGYLPCVHSKRSPCVHSKRHRVYRQHVHMFFTCGRFAARHADVLNVHTWVGFIKENTRGVITCPRGS